MKLTKSFRPAMFHYKNLKEAWEGVNEYLANKQDDITRKGGVIYGNEMVSFDNHITVENARLDPKFNFGRILGYKNKKWSKLVNNYVNFDYLDLVKSEVRHRESKNSHNYNYTYHFDNSHGSGKDCLISLTFCRRKGFDKPIVIYNTRASEVTKRLAFDFLLIQRMVEYVYGPKQRVSLICSIPFMFINLECFLMYLADKGDKIITKSDKGYTPYQLRILQRFHEFQTMDVNKIKYKVHARAAKQVQRDKKGNPISGVPDMFAEELQLHTFTKIRQKEIDQLESELEQGKTINKKEKKIKKKK
jgi:hypothetical protein